jgi:hypothetical protein
MPKATGSFEVLSGSDHPYEELEGGGRLTRAAGLQSFSGDITGDGAVTWLMAFRGDGTAHSIGLQRITGTIGGRRGTFLIEAAGAFDGKASTGTWAVIRDSGSGDLAGISGVGTWRAGPGPQGSYELDHDLG